ncbi:Mip2 [Desulforapulum autotrophicum HRM2]|uniref:Peptidyl-prolyl cis-trans isomerase n=1 Tax=Desulforapulum autotrophicum (strain ATCC 43914 / DSM 3382 / VKM B-1955 / HRM2) TaxID=177437 RepID=C0QG53_DESAH|nr:FKBP-type peptidyl-prolyl cis-trans isomerase [Desulforapulum autotrophicum]ACN17632.1 Mip2 [Desulforapulum autotrophicum HRM2]
MLAKNITRGLTVATALLFIAGSGFCADETLKTEKEKISYALGATIGNNIKQDYAVDQEAFFKGFTSSTTGKILMTAEEMQQSMAIFQQQMQASQMAKMQAVADKNKIDGDVFLAENKVKEGVVTLESGLQYKVIKNGEGKKPVASDTVECNYRGTTIDGVEFDSSYKRGKPASFPVQGVIKGWTEALQLMNVGSKWMLYIPADLAYGDRGAGPTIQPGTTLIFEIELLGISG